MPDGEARIKALHDVTEEQSKLNEMLAKYNVELAQNESAQKSCDIEQKRLSGDSRQWIKDMEHDMPTINVALEDIAKKGLADVNSGIAKSIVEGKNFGQAMAMAGKQAAEAIIELIAKEIELWVIKKIMGDDDSVEKQIAKNKSLQMSEAQLAGAKAMAESGWPAMLVVGPAVFAEAMAFAAGGLVPGSGNYDSVPAMLTPGESVVTKALTQQVENSQGGSSNQGHTVHIHMGDVHAVDAKGFEGLLEKHAAVVGKHVQSQMRRMHRKVN
jgi:hypothetical protein